uniref:Ran-binding protein 6 n=1 Tax=Heterodera glycines TaxID=51029 RepID=M4GQA8_HETGL|nr:ran-binding protein 6 [Heterodera glycines]
MATFSVALLIILVGVGSMASSVRSDEQQNQNPTENGGGLKHLFGLDGIRENQIVLAEKMSGIGAKLEKIENGMSDNQNVMAEKMLGIEAKLEKQIENGKAYSLISLLSSKILEQEIKNAIRENQNVMAEKMSGIEAKLEKQIEKGIRDNHKEPSPMMNNSTLALFHFHSLPIYRWNASDCHPEIVINEGTNAIQTNATGTEELSGFRSCRAGPIHIPSAAAGRIGIIYAEYRIIAKNLILHIGLSTKEMPLCNSLGYAPISYGYASFGVIEGKNANGNGVKIGDNVPFFDTGDVVGCGLNWATRQVFFTKNGQRLDITNLYVDEETADFYPTVSMLSYGAAVEANFGPNFQYDVSKKF